MSSFRSLKHGVSGMLVAMLLLIGPPAARANPEMRKELAEVAKSLKQLLDGQNEDSIAVGQFQGPANLPTSAGPGIAQILSEELQKLGKTVKPRAKYGVRGEYRATEVPSEDEPRIKLMAIKIKGTVEDEFGKVITDFSFERTIKSENAFVSLLGTPVDLPPRLTPEKRSQRLRDSLSKPRTRLQGARVSVGEDAQYAVELWVNGKPRAAKEDEGLAFVKIDRGESYAVRLINDSDREAGVRLSIDGLNVFEFSELRHKEGDKKGEPLYSVWLVPPKSSILIKGWHRNNEVSDSFLVTEYAKSAAASLNAKANVGTITASFSAAWPIDRPPPKDEPPKQKGITSGDGTGFGPPVEMKVTAVKRNVGAIRESVSVRYTK
jgi:hypothetical protein